MAKKSGNTHVIVTEKEYKRLLKEHTALATDFALAGVYMALRDGEGFGTKRLTRLHERVTKLFTEINEGRIDLLDIYETMRDECGIVFENGNVDRYARLRKRVAPLEEELYKR